MAEPTADKIIASVQEDKARQGPGLAKTIGGIAGLTLLALAGGAATGFLIRGQQPVAIAEPEAQETAAAAQAPAAEPAGSRLLIPLAAVVTNIASPPTTFLRVEASVVVDPEEVEEPSVLAAQIGSDTLTFLRSLELAQIEGSRGLLHLREDLKERAQLRSPAVSDYIIQSLVAQ